MKKYLLGALFVLGTMAYAQGNRVIEPVVDGNATANLGIEVTGQVFEPTQKSLVVEIESAASADGTGFAFRMPHLFKGMDEVKTAVGKFNVKVLTSNTPEAIDGTLAVNLRQGGIDTGANTTAVTGKPSGTASDTEIKYNLTGGLNTAETIYKGDLAVSAKAGSKVGTYSDTSVELVVDLSGQTGA